MWPALVAAIHTRPADWTAEQLIDAATSHAGASHAPDVRPEDLCSALVWRIATMTDTPTEETEPSEPDLFYIEDDGPAPAPIPADHVPEPRTTYTRILELNAAALTRYSSMYDRSWAPDYLRNRLHTDLADDTRFTVGYAPPGPSSLLTHLTDQGATIEELLDAGLARETERGHIVDTFRDRLVFPIRSPAGIVGFVGRRNPAKDHHPYGGPKYLNTRATVAFSKGDTLFGLIEGSADLASGATPVLVEGPMDAIAVTHATSGAYVGVAPLGTSITEAQAAALRPYVADDPVRVVIATDPDPAGQQSAERAFWRLAAERATPRHAIFPEGLDPADLLRRNGAPALIDRLSMAPDFAQLFLDGLIERRLTEHNDAFARVDIARDAARLVGALPPDRWPGLASELAEQLDLPLPTIQEEIYRAGTRWTDDPRGCSDLQIAALRPSVAWHAQPYAPGTPSDSRHEQEPCRPPARFQLEHDPPG